MPRIFTHLLASAALLFSTGLAAHTFLQTSIPEAGAVLTQSPPVLELEYSGASRLLRLSLVEKDLGEIPLAFSPSREAASHFHIDLPTLQSGDYTLRWVSMGEDGHRMSGEIPFRIAEPGEKAE